LSKYLAEVDIGHGNLGWSDWSSWKHNTSWNAPSARQFRRIFDKKAEKAKAYNLQGARLWLVVVCGVSGDLSSHVFPTLPEDIDNLRLCIASCGFDLESSPFSEVWLFSWLALQRMQLYPLPKSYY
jgi:hypothetical protein